MLDSFRDDAPPREPVARALAMKVVQAVFGVFHHFDLARELERRGHLEKVYSTWPMARLRREGLPSEKAGTFPRLHMPQFC